MVLDEKSTTLTPKDDLTMNILAPSTISGKNPTTIMCPENKLLSATKTAILVIIFYNKENVDTNSDELGTNLFFLQFGPTNPQFPHSFDTVADVQHAPRHETGRDARVVDILSQLDHEDKRDDQVGERFGLQTAEEEVWLEEIPNETFEVYQIGVLRYGSVEAVRVR